MNRYYKINLNMISDGRGDLIALQKSNIVPFDIKRVYYLANLSKQPRGFHAHKKLSQLIICVAGSFTLKLDDGINKNSYILDSIDKGVVIENVVWREMESFSNDCVILVLASEIYDENDYIRCKKEFEDLVK